MATRRKHTHAVLKAATYGVNLLTAASAAIHRHCSTNAPSLPNCTPIIANAESAECSTTRTQHEAGEEHEHVVHDEGRPVAVLLDIRAPDHQAQQLEAPRLHPLLVPGWTIRKQKQSEGTRTQ